LPLIMVVVKSYGLRTPERIGYGEKKDF